MFLSKVIERKHSKFNGDVKVINTFGLGTYIQAGGLTQSGGIVKAIWSNVLKKIAKQDLPIKNVLILGYGGGTVAAIIKKHWEKSKIIGIDIDSVIVGLGEKYTYKNPDAKILISDALVYLRKHPKQKFDLIILDLYQEDKFPKKFESTAFLRLLKRHLVTKGKLVANRLFYGDKKRETLKFGMNLNKIFTIVEKFRPVANMMFICSDL